MGALLEVDAFFQQQVLNLIGQSKSIHSLAPFEMNKHTCFQTNYAHTNAHIFCDQ